MFTKENMDKIIAQMRDYMGIHLAFGTPHKLGKIMVIPVAKISMGFGFGSGPGKKVKVGIQSDPAPEPDIEAEDDVKTEDSAKTEVSGGGGMGGSAKPVGVFVISENSTRFFPVVSSTQIFVAMSIISLVWWRFWRKAFKKK